MKIRFGEFELDSRRYRLRRNGETIALRPKVFDLLIYLVRHRERVVPREELVRMCWGETRVGEGSLSGLVNELRSALGEGGRGPSSIRTVHARGYQFVAHVEPAAEASAEAGSEWGGTDESGGTPAGLRRIRLELGRMLAEGPRGLVLLVESVDASLALLEQTVALAGHLGVESLRVGRPGRLDREREIPKRGDLPARLLEVVVERWGLPALRGLAARELDRLLRPRARERGSEALIWDGALRRLLRRIAHERPLLLILDLLGSFDRDSLELVESLIGIDLESAPLLVVASVDLASLVSPAGAEGSDGPQLDHLLFGSGFTLFRHLDPERAQLEAWCRARGVEPLPEPLVEALLTHLAGRGRADDGLFKAGKLELEREPSARLEARPPTRPTPCEALPETAPPRLPERPGMLWARAGRAGSPGRTNERGG